MICHSYRAELVTGKILPNLESVLLPGLTMKYIKEAVLSEVFSFVIIRPDAIVLRLKIESSVATLTSAIAVSARSMARHS